MRLFTIAALLTITCGPLLAADNGVYRVLGIQSEKDFNASDVEFESAYKTLPKNQEKAKDRPVVIAVVDSGIWAKDQEYLTKHWMAGKNFLNDPPTETKMQPPTMVKHGSCVASIACFGTDRIKLIDVMIESTQEGGGQFDADKFVTGVSWAISQGARVVNCSKQVDWSDSKVQDLVSSNANVLFVSSAGNNSAEYKFRTKAGRSYTTGNNILVGGCSADGKFIPERGYGMDVDLAAPSQQVPCLAPYEVRHEAYTKIALKKYQDAVEQYKAKNTSNSLTPERRKEIQDAEEAYKKAAPGLQKNLAEQKLKKLRAGANTDPEPRKPPEPERHNLTTDDGVSFACPMVANVAAKMLVLNSKLTPKEIVDLLVFTALKTTGTDGLKGKNKAGGYLNPAEAYKGAVLSLSENKN